MTTPETPPLKAPVGIRNNNPANIRFNPAVSWQGQAGEGEGGFAKFTSMVMGIRAAAKLLLTYFNKHGLNTITKIISRWAPPNENNTSEYVKTVCALTGYFENQELAPTKLVLYALLRAIFRVENGGFFVSDTVILAGVDEALT